MRFILPRLARRLFGPPLREALSDDQDFTFKSPDAAPLRPWDCCNSVVHAGSILIRIKPRYIIWANSLILRFKVAAGATKGADRPI